MRHLQFKLRHVSGALWLVLGGCAVGPDYVRPKPDTPPSFVAVPANAAANGAAGARASAGTLNTGGAPDSPSPNPDLWWHSLHDAELDSLVERALRSNLDIKIALDRLQQARSYEAVVAGHALPEIDGSGAAAHGTGADLMRGRAQQALVSADNTSGLQHINAIGGFDAIWELDVFGKYRREFQAARADAQARAAARNAVIISVIADVAHAYVDLRGLQVQLGVLQKARDVLSESLRIINIRYQRGITNELDVALARRELATFAAQIEPVNAQVSAAQSTIAVLLGEYPESIAQELAAPDLVPSTPPAVTAGIPLDLLKRRPDIQQAERELAAATAHIGAATADLFPQISLVGAVGAQAQGLGVAPHRGSHIWSFGPGALWPLLDFGALDAEVNIAHFEAQAQLETYRKTILDAVREVDTAAAAYAAQQGRLSQLGAAMLAAQRAADLAGERYNRGLTDFLNVVDAERQLYDLQEQYAAAQVTEAEQFVTLYKSLGGGWQNYQNVPAIPLPEPAIVAMFRRTISNPAPR